MMPSAAWMISSPFAAACGFSILAISGTSTSRAFEVLPHRVEVLAAAHEREREEVHAHVEPGVDQPDVLLAHRRQRDRHVRKVEALPGGHAAADLDLRDHLAVVDLVHAQPDGAVREVEHVALVAQLREALPGHRQPLRGALHLLPGEHHLRVARQLGHPAGHRADPQLGPGQVTEDRHVALRALRGRAHRLRDFPVLLRVAVREIEPGHVHAGSDHLLEDVEILRGWTDGRDDLRGAHRLQHTHPMALSRKARS